MNIFELVLVEQILTDLTNSKLHDFGATLAAEQYMYITSEDKDFWQGDLEVWELYYYYGNIQIWTTYVRLVHMVYCTKFQVISFNLRLIL